MAAAIGASDKVVNTFISTTATTPGVTTTASGSSFYVGILTGASETISSVTDSKSNGYSAVGSALTYNGAALKMIMYKAENGTGGASHTVSVTIGATNFLTVFFLEVTAAGAGGEDTAVRASGEDTSSPFTVTSGTLSQANEVLIVLGGTDSTTVSALAESTGFTIAQSVLTGTSDAAGFIAAKVVSSTGTYTPSFTATGPAAMGLWITGVKDPSGAANVPKMLVLGVG